MKNVRDISIEAYRRIKDEGLLSEKREEVYEVLYQHGPATAMELRRHFPRGIIDSQIRARLNELREHGVVKEVQTRVCTVTGMRVIEWDATSALPSERQPRKKRDELEEVKAEIHELKREVAELRRGFGRGRNREVKEEQLAFKV